MKQYKIINAYRTLELLSKNEKLSDAEQWEIYKLRKLMRRHNEFQAEREDAIRDKYSEYTDDKGMINGEQAQAFLKDMQDLNNLEIELEEIDKPKIKFVKGITCEIAEPLEDFIEFLPPAE